MARRRRPRNNPGALATFGWAAGTAAVTGLATYYVLREVYVAQILERCEIFRIQKQQIAQQTGMQGAMPSQFPPLTKDRARSWF